MRKFLSYIFLIIAFCLWVGTKEYDFWWEPIFNGDKLWDLAYWREGLHFIYAAIPRVVEYYLINILIFGIIIWRLLHSKILIFDKGRYLKEFHSLTSSRFIKFFFGVIPSNVTRVFIGGVFLFLSYQNVQGWISWRDNFPMEVAFRELKSAVAEKVKNEWDEPYKEIVYVDPEKLEALAQQYQIISKQDLRNWIKFSGFSVYGVSFSISSPVFNKQKELMEMIKQILQKAPIVKVDNRKVLAFAKSEESTRLKKIEDDYGVTCEHTKTKVAQNRWLDVYLNKEAQQLKSSKDLIFLTGPFDITPTAYVANRVFSNGKNAFSLSLLLNEKASEATVNQVAVLGDTLKVLAVPVKADGAHFVAIPVVIWF